MSKPNLTIVMKKILLFLIVLSFSSCKNNNPLIFDIGESRERVLNVICDDFLIGGSHWNKSEILERENGNHITLYDCEYCSRYYRKVRIYYKNDLVRKVEIKTPKDKYPTLLDDIENAYGTPHTTRLPYIFATYVDAKVWFKEGIAIVSTERNGEYELLLLSGEDRDRLSNYMN